MLTLLQYGGPYVTEVPDDDASATSAKDDVEAPTKSGMSPTVESDAKKAPLTNGVAGSINGGTQELDEWVSKAKGITHIETPMTSNLLFVGIVDASWWKGKEW